jgi:serine/threonine protein kinase
VRSVFFISISTTKSLNYFSETHDNQVIEGEQEETAQEEIYKDSQTKIVLPRQNVDSYIFHLPDDYKAVKILGSGAHGVVAAATTMSADKQIAIKQIKLNLEPSCNDDENLYRWKSVYRELLLLAQLREKGGHPNVIGLKNVFFVSMSNEYEIMFLTNLMETSLETLMNSRSLESSEKKWYIYQILCGLAYLHSNNISE